MICFSSMTVTDPGRCWQICVVAVYLSFLLLHSKYSQNNLLQVSVPIIYLTLSTLTENREKIRFCFDLSVTWLLEDIKINTVIMMGFLLVCLFIHLFIYLITLQTKDYSMTVFWIPKSSIIFEIRRLLFCVTK